MEIYTLEFSCESLHSVIDGEVEGLDCFVVPKSQITNFFKDRSNMIGVYLLVGRCESGYDVYVGQTGNLRDRFEQHKKMKDFWEKAVFCAGRFNSAKLDYFESEMWVHFNGYDSIFLKNKNKPSSGSFVSERKKNGFDKILKKFKLFSNLMIPSEFLTEEIKPKLVPPPIAPKVVVPPKPIPYVPRDTKHSFICTNNGVKAYMKIKTGKYIVQQYSVIKKGNPKYKHLEVYKIRDKLKNDGIIKFVKSGNYILYEDVGFDSPSMAAEFVLGVPANGGVEWKTEKGKYLKDILP